MTSLAAYVPWTTLRSVGNSYAVRLTVLIPLVGYLLIFNTYIVEQLALGKTFVDPATASSPIQRLLVTYFGLCSLAVGAMLYAWRCPPHIKLYPTAAAFAGGDGPHISEFDYFDIERFVEHFAKEKFEEIKQAFPTIQSGPFESYEVRATKRKNATLTLLFRQLNLSHPKARVVTAFFFGLGFLLLGLLSLQVFWRALGIFWRSLF